MKKILSIIVWFIFLVPGIYLLSIWQTIPAKVPMHYNLEGEADRYGNKTELVLMLAIITGVNIGVYLLLSNVHRIDRKKYAQENKDRMHRMAFVVSVFISALLCILIYSSANEMSSIKFLPGIVFSAIGILFSFIGNYLYNIKPNYYAGFRVSWTLNNEENWKKTHHVAGKLWFIGGLLIAILCLLLPLKASIITFFIATAILVVIPGVYSYRLHKKQLIHKK